MKKFRLAIIALSSILFVGIAFAEFGLGVGGEIWGSVDPAGAGCIETSAGSGTCQLFPAGDQTKHITVFMLDSGTKSDGLWSGDPAVIATGTGEISAGGANGTTGAGANFPIGPGGWNSIPSARTLYQSEVVGMGAGYCITPYHWRGMIMYVPCMNDTSCSDYATAVGVGAGFGTCNLRPSGKQFAQAGLFVETSVGNIHAFIQEIRQ